jgi:SPP1 family predicted phage head-tail adaptor
MLILVFATRLGKRVKDGQELAQYYNMKLGKAKSDYIDANTMTRQVTIYANNQVSDGQGGYTMTFVQQGVVWGDLRPDNKVREIDTLELAFDQRNRLYIRYGITITDKYEVEIDGQRYTIHSIKDVENQHRFLELIIYK